MSIGVAVVGYGRSGRQFHCHLIRRTPVLELRAVVSSRPEARERVGREQGCRAYANLDDALADPQIDLIVLATPNYTHAPLAIKAMEAGKHVVTDKVMCLNLAECDAMLATAERHGVMLSVFQNRRFDGDFLTVRRLWESGELGEVRWLEMAWQGFKPWGGWRGQASMGGGRYYDLGAHLVDQLCLLFPSKIETVYCRMHHDHPGTDVESEALLVVTFAGGYTGVCDFSSLAAISKPRFYVRGTKGTFIKYGLDPQEAALMAGDIDAAVEDPANYGRLHDGTTERVIPTLPGRWRSYYESVAAVLLAGAEPLVKPAELRRQISVLDAGLRSAASGEVVRL